MQVIEETKPFFHWLARWYDNLPPAALSSVFPNSAAGAVLVADLIIGFCKEGPLASKRIDAIVRPTVDLLCRANERGVQRFVLAQDTHAPNTPEFEAWPPHCVRGTRESEMVPELRSLPFSGLFTIVEKNALSAGMGTELEAWLSRNEDVTDYVVAGDCTDLCTYNLALFVRMWANAGNLAGKRVWVDASTVQTYDLPVSEADGALPHPGDFTHMYFLYHLALNGVQVVSAID